MGKDARVFGQDLMRGEHVVGSDSDRAAIPAGLLYGEIQTFDGARRTLTGTSIFDPVLCELAYRWFSPPGDLVLDPFSGGSVRGIVAAKCGRRYVGIDLSARQVVANREQAARICGEGIIPEWIVGDSAVILATIDCAADFVFSCPPYGDLEIYSDSAADISSMSHPAFLVAYRAIIAAAAGKLKPDRFACFVVGDFRDKRGFYRNFVGETVAAFEAAGARLYNEAVLVTEAGSLPIRAGRQFMASRKLGKTHQNMLVFCKGDPRKSMAACGHVELDASIFQVADVSQYGEEL
ncbi:MAG: DNA methyltransferase [Methylocella sp.]